MLRRFRHECGGNGYRISLLRRRRTPCSGHDGTWDFNEDSLSNLTPSRLLILSLACAVGNAIFLKLAFLLVNVETSGMPDYLCIVIGDGFGTWVMIYVIKTGV